MSKSSNPFPEVQDDAHQTEQEPRDLEDLQVTEAVERIDQPPNEEEGIKPRWKVYPPISFTVLVLLIPASILGTLARLGLLAMTKYDGESIFPLAYVQAVGCLVMGFGLRLKEPIGRSYVDPIESSHLSLIKVSQLWSLLHSSDHRYARTGAGPATLRLIHGIGFCGSLTTFSGWQLDIWSSWVNAEDHLRSGFHSVSASYSEMTLFYIVRSSLTGWESPSLPYPSRWHQFHLDITLQICLHHVFPHSTSQAN